MFVACEVRQKMEMAGKKTMAIRLKYPDGSTELIPEAIRVDGQNFHEGMYDFYDERGVLLRQVDMHSKITWELVDETEKEADEHLKKSS